MVAQIGQFYICAEVKGLASAEVDAFQTAQGVFFIHNDSSRSVVCCLGISIEVEMIRGQGHARIAQGHISIGLGQSGVAIVAQIIGIQVNGVVLDHVDILKGLQEILIGIKPGRIAVKEGSLVLKDD